MDTITLYTETLDQMNKTFLKMTSFEWDLRLLEATKEEKELAAQEFARVQTARLRLGNAVLREISSALAANEDALISGRKEVARAIEKIEKLESTLKQIASFVDVVGRVVTLV